MASEPCTKRTWQESHPQAVQVAESLLNMLRQNGHNARLRWEKCHLKKLHILIFAENRKAKIADCEPFPTGRGTYVHLYPFERAEPEAGWWKRHFKALGINGSWQPSTSRVRISISPYPEAARILPKLDVTIRDVI